MKIPIRLKVLNKKFQKALMSDDYSDNYEDFDNEESEPYDPFNIFPSGSPILPGFSDIFSIGFGNHLADCFFFSFGNDQIEVNANNYKEFAEKMINSILGPPQAKVWKNKILIKDELDIEYKNYKNNNMKYLIKEPPQYRGLFDILN